MKSNKYLIIFYITSGILIIYSLYLIIDWYLENKQNTNLQDHTIEITTIEEQKDKYPYLKTDISNLIKENNETIGWIQVPNTNINYPVVQSTDNDYYLSHNFNKESNSAGWPFMDYRNDKSLLDSNTLIYAHNRLDGSMFGTLKNTLNEEWHSSNKYIFYNTDKTLNTYEVFSVYTVNVNDFKSTINFKSDEDFNDYLNIVKNKSIINLNVKVDYNDKILTLYTCSNNNNERTILHAKLVQTKKSE